MSSRATVGAAEQTGVAEAAKRYLARGWSVLPLRPLDKRPLRWENLQNERPCEDDIAEWFQRWPDANVGIVTREISNLIVLDVDPKHGGDATLERLEHRFRPLSATVEAVTGGGGRHLFFAHSGDLTRNRAGLTQGVDLRGDGGYIVAPPSIHPSGCPYTWVTGRGPDEITLAPLPHWVIAPIRGPRIGTGAGWCMRMWLKVSEFNDRIDHWAFAVARRRPRCGA